MKTDQAIYELLSTGAEAFRVLTGGLRLTGPYQFRSVTFKALERRADGVFEPMGQAAPVLLVACETRGIGIGWQPEKHSTVFRVGIVSGMFYPRISRDSSKNRLPRKMNAIEFHAVAHDGILDIPPEHRRILDGKTVRVVLVDAEPKGTDGKETIFARLRRVKTQGPTDLSTNHDAYIVGERDA